MRNDCIVVNLAHSVKAQRLVKAQSMGLRAQFYAGNARYSPKALHRVTDQRRANSAPTRMGQHTNAPNLAHLGLHQQAGGPYGLAIVTRQKVNGNRVQIVQRVGFQHALFVNKHCTAQRTAQGDVAGLCDGHAHAK